LVLCAGAITNSGRPILVALFWSSAYAPGFTFSSRL
jgi:hypothetical protein